MIAVEMELPLPARRARLRWTKEEDNRLLAMLEEHRSYPEIALALYRPLQGVWERIQKLGVTLRTANGRTQSEVAELLGVDHVTAMRWRRRGWLQAHNPGRRTVIIEEEDLYAFLEDPIGWAEWRPERVTDPTWREWAMELRRDEAAYVTTDEAAELACVVRQAIVQAVRTGRLRAIRAADRLLVRKDQVLLAFAPDRRPARSRTPAPAGHCTRPEVLEIIRREWGARPTRRIAADLGISEERAGQIGRNILGLPPLGRGRWRRRVAQPTESARGV